MSVAEDTDSGAMQWFGPTWGSHLNAICVKTTTPVGALCLFCDLPIEEDDRGVTMIGVGFEDRVGYTIPDNRVAVHIDCHIKSFMPDVSLLSWRRYLPERKIKNECTCRTCGRPASMKHTPPECAGWS